MEDYKLNSFKSKEATDYSTKHEKKEKVVSGVATTRKKSEAKKLAEMFIAEDLSTVAKNIIRDVLIPSAKETLSEMVKSSIDMLLFHEVRPGQKRPTVSTFSYNKCFTSQEPNRVYSGTRSACDYDEIIFPSRGDAEAVLSAMEDVIDQYGMVSVADMYDMADVTNTNYAANRYGWVNIRSAGVQRLRDGGYVIKMPKAIPLD